MKTIEKSVDELSIEHAFEVLGEEQFQDNTDAANAIAADFKAGFLTAQSLYGEKARKWDELDNKIGKFYPDDDEEDEGGDLCDIGELCARKFGYM